MRSLALLLLVACGRYDFVDLDAAADACVSGGSCTPTSAVCWSGVASCGATSCALAQPLDQTACPAGTCATGICVGGAGTTITAGGANAYFGTSVDSDGQRLVVGAVTANSAYVLERTGAAWTVAATLTSAWGPASSDFGSAVAIEGDLIVVGARYSKGPGIAPVSGTGGAIVIFQRDASNEWVEIADVLGPDGGEFGSSLDLQGGRIVVGAEYGTTIANGYGDAYIVEGAGASWVVVATFADVGADRLGHFVQLAGDRAVVGSLWDPGPHSTESGAIRIWERQASATWALTQTLQPDDLRVDAFGQGFSLDGDRLAVGDPGFSDPERGTGALYLYTRDPATNLWTTPGPILPAIHQKDHNFGRGIRLRGERLFATGIDWLSTPSGAVSTSVYRLQPDASWLEVGRRVDPDGGDNGFAYGGIECDLQMSSADDDVFIGYPIRNYANGPAPGAVVVQDMTGM